MRRAWRTMAGAGPAMLLAALGWYIAPVASAAGHGTAGEAATVLHPLGESRPLAQAPPTPKSEKDRIIEIAEKRYNAKVVRIDEAVVKGRRAYVLRLLSKESSSRPMPVMERTVDAVTGTELQP